MGTLWLSLVTEVNPLQVTAGHHTNGARRAESVKVLKPDSWRYSRNYGYLVSRQRRNGPRGLHLWGRQNYAKYAISMSYGNIQANNKNRHADNVMRANHGNGLQQPLPEEIKCKSCKTKLRDHVRFIMRYLDFTVIYHANTTVKCSKRNTPNERHVSCTCMKVSVCAATPSLQLGYWWIILSYRKSRICLFIHALSMSSLV